MRLIFYSDPHLGLTRTAHTTKKSATALRSALHHELTKILNIEADMFICLGDLFDTYSNSEAVLQQGIHAIENTGLTLAGNHDLRNHAESVSSLQLLSQLFSQKVVVNDWDETQPTFVDLGNSRLVFIPHMNSQDNFEKALDEAVEVARDSMKWNVLCLHCNVGMEGMSDSSTTLNLTNDKAEKLLYAFHHILVGHEHIPRDLHGNRLRIIGNHHPTGFSDISDKRVISYDTEAGETESIQVWVKEHNHWAGPVSRAPGTTCPFMDLEDDLPPGEAFRAVTKMFSEGDAYCIRLTSPTVIAKSDKQATLEEVERLPDIVEAGIASDHPELLPLWKELRDAATLKAE